MNKVRKNAEKILRIAVSKKDAETTKLLLRAGIDVNASGPDSGKTALHWAAKNQDATLIQLLVTAGANTSIRDNEGKPAIDYVSNRALRALFSPSSAASTARFFSELRGQTSIGSFRP